MRKWTAKLREAIRFRDKFMCQKCRKSEAELKQKLDVHHIDYDSSHTNNADTNLISLCRNCHSKTGGHRWWWRRWCEKRIKKLYND